MLQYQNSVTSKKRCVPWSEAIIIMLCINSMKIKKCVLMTLVTHTFFYSPTYQGRQRCWPAGWASCVSGPHRSQRWWRWCSSPQARSAAGTHTPPAWRTESRSRSRPRWCCTWAQRDMGIPVTLLCGCSTVFEILCHYSSSEFDRSPIIACLYCIFKASCKKTCKRVK